MLADPVALEQIVHNLVDNAVRALESVPAGRRRLTLETGTHSGHGTLVVRDSGPGIAPEALPRVLEPFFTTRQGGLGLGLALADTLAQSMEGSLHVANVEPQGAQFTLRLPLAGAAR